MYYCFKQKEDVIDCLKFTESKVNKDIMLSDRSLEVMRQNVALKT